MRQIRIYTPQPLASGEAVALDSEARHHLTKVLRLRAGDAVRLFNGDGKEYGAQLRTVDRSGAIALVDAAPPVIDPQPKLRIALFQCVAKGERTDWIIQKSVELGICSITLLLCERGVVRLTKERLAGREDHWRRVLISACEQSGRSRLPGLRIDTSASEALVAADENGARYLLDPGADACLATQPAPGEAPVTLFVGPEGGLSDSEQALARKSGFRSVRLGPRILRTETAPLAAIAAMQALWGDFRA